MPGILQFDSVEKLIEAAAEVACNRIAALTSARNDLLDILVLIEAADVPELMQLRWGDGCGKDHGWGDEIQARIAKARETA